MRTSTWMGVVPPTRSNDRVCRTRNSLTCTEGLISPISSRKSVPPSAASKRPSRLPAAPVNEPFSCPNSSLSSSVSESAAHDTLMNGLSLRGDCSWSACATSSFPVPDSPSTSTVALVGAARFTTSNTACSSGDSPTMPSSR